jgi:hypothetical protein
MYAREPNAAKTSIHSNTGSTLPTLWASSASTADATGSKSKAFWPTRAISTSQVPTVQAGTGTELNGREQRARDALDAAFKEHGDGLVETLPKFKYGDDLQEYSKIARAASERIIRTIEKIVLDSANTPN